MNYKLIFEVTLLNSKGEEIPKDGLVEGMIKDNLFTPMNKVFKKLLEQHGLKVDVTNNLIWVD